MKTLIFCLLLSCAMPFARADDVAFEVQNPSLILNGNQVKLGFALAALPTLPRDVKILFCDCPGLSEDSPVQPYVLWLAGVADGKTTIRQMISTGWTLQSIVVSNARQFYVVFVK